MAVPIALLALFGLVVLGGVGLAQLGGLRREVDDLRRRLQRLEPSRTTGTATTLAALLTDQPPQTSPQPTSPQPTSPQPTPPPRHSRPIAREAFADESFAPEEAAATEISAAPQRAPVFGPFADADTLAEENRQSLATDPGTRPSPAAPVSFGQRPSSDSAELSLVKAMMWVGAVTVVLGFGFLYVYASENGWITNTGRLISGTLAGSLLLGGALFGRRRDFCTVSDGLAAAGSGTLMLTAYFAGFWEVLSPLAAFVAMVIAVVPLWAYAICFRSRLAASLASVTALLPPAILVVAMKARWLPPHLDAALFLTYAGVVTAATATIVWVRGWRLPAAITIAGGGVALCTLCDDVPVMGGLAATAAFFVTLLWLALAPALRESLARESDGNGGNDTDEVPLSLLDSPMLLAAVGFLLAALIHIAETADASRLLATLSPTALAASLAGLFFVVGGHLPRSLRATLLSTCLFVAAACVPLWLSPAWTLVSWAGIGLLWARVAIREDSLLAGGLSLLALAVTQLVVVLMFLKLAAPGVYVPPQLLDGPAADSLPTVVTGLLDGFQLRDGDLVDGGAVVRADANLAALSLNARSLGLAALGAVFLVIARLSRLRQWAEHPFERLDVSPKQLAEAATLLAVGNLIAAAWSEIAWQASIRSLEWDFQAGWAAIVAAAAIGMLGWLGRDRDFDAASRTGTVLGMLLGVIVSGFAAVCLVATVIAPSDLVAALDRTPFANLLFAMLTASAAGLIVAARRLFPRGDEWSLPLWPGVAMVATLAANESMRALAIAGLSSPALSAMVTIGLAIAGVVVMAIGFGRADVQLRQLGLGLLVLASAKVYVVDIWTASTFVRIVALLLLGGSLLGATVAYRRFREQFVDLFADDAAAGESAADAEHMLT